MRVRIKEKRGNGTEKRGNEEFSYTFVHKRWRKKRKIKIKKWRNQLKRGTSHAWSTFPQVLVVFMVCRQKQSIAILLIFIFITHSYLILTSFLHTPMYRGEKRKEKHHFPRNIITFYAISHLFHFVKISLFFPPCPMYMLLNKVEPNFKEFKKRSLRRIDNISQFWAKFLKCKTSYQISTISKLQWRTQPTPHVK